MAAATAAALAAPGTAGAQGPELAVSVEQAARTLRCSADVAGAQRDPVLFIPGTTVNSREDFEWTWLRAFAAQGRPYCTYDHPANGMADIQLSGEHVVRHLRAIRALAGRRVDVVGHSQGGMVARWALRFWPDTRELVDDVIGMAPSNHGTDLAVPLCAVPGGCAPSVWQQRTGSAFLRALNSEAETFAGIDYTAIYTRTDEVVLPNQNAATGSSALRGGEGDITNVAIQDLCPLDLNEHLAIGLYDNVAHHIALDALDHEGPAVPSRVPDVCDTTTMREVDRLTGFTSLLDSGAVVGLTLLRAQRVAAEPPLRPYAATALRRAGTRARPLSAKRRSAARRALRLLRRSGRAARVRTG